LSLAIRFLETPPTVVKSPPISIFPSGCTAMAPTRMFALGSKPSMADWEKEIPGSTSKMNENKNRAFFPFMAYFSYLHFGSRISTLDNPTDASETNSVSGFMILKPEDLSRVFVWRVDGGRLQHEGMMIWV